MVGKQQTFTTCMDPLRKNQTLIFFEIIQIHKMMMKQTKCLNPEIHSWSISMSNDTEI